MNRDVSVTNNWLKTALTEYASPETIKYVKSTTSIVIKWTQYLLKSANMALRLIQAKNKEGVKSLTSAVEKYSNNVDSHVTVIDNQLKSLKQSHTTQGSDGQLLPSAIKAAKAIHSQHLNNIKKEIPNIGKADAADMKKPLNLKLYISEIIKRCNRPDLLNKLELKSRQGNSYKFEVQDFKGYLPLNNKGRSSDVPDMYTYPGYEVKVEGKKITLITEIIIEWGGDALSGYVETVGTL